MINWIENTSENLKIHKVKNYSAYIYMTNMGYIIDGKCSYNISSSVENGEHTFYHKRYDITHFCHRADFLNHINLPNSMPL
jgi:hypothetical protein